MKTTNFIVYLLLPITILSNYCYSMEEQINNQSIKLNGSISDNWEIVKVDEDAKKYIPNGEIYCCVKPNTKCPDTFQVKMSLEKDNNNKNVVIINDNNQKFISYDKFENELNKHINDYKDYNRCGILQINNEKYIAFFVKDDNEQYYEWSYLDSDGDFNVLGTSPADNFATKDMWKRVNIDITTAVLPENFNIQKDEVLCCAYAKSDVSPIPVLKSFFDEKRIDIISIDWDHYRRSCFIIPESAYEHIKKQEIQDSKCGVIKFNNKNYIAWFVEDKQNKICTWYYLDGNDHVRKLGTSKIFD